MTRDEFDKSIHKLIRFYGKAKTDEGMAAIQDEVNGIFEQLYGWNPVEFEEVTLKMSMQGKFGHRLAPGDFYRARTALHTEKRAHTRAVSGVCTACNGVGMCSKRYTHDGYPGQVFDAARSCAVCRPEVHAREIMNPHLTEVRD